MYSNEITKAQFNRTVKMFNEMAGENMHVRFFSGAFWVFGSELATLRIAKKYSNCNDVSQGYSANLSAHYFKLETSFTGEMETA